MGGESMIYTVTLNPSIDHIIRLNGLNMGELNRIQEDQFFPGGKGINVSRILNNLGYDNTALGFIGGFTGEFLESELNKEKIKSKFTQIENPTRINVKIKTEVETELNGTGPVVSNQCELNFLNTIAGITPNDMVIISGSKPRNLPIDYYQQIIQIINEIGANFVIDTTGEELHHSLPYHPFLVKPNHVELGELYGVKLNTEDDFIKYGQKLVDEGAKFAIVSLGSNGAILFSNQGTYRGNSPKGTVKNTVGSGDSMIAGFVGTYLKTNDLQKSFKVGLASGSATAFAEDLATKEEIETLLTEIHIKKL